MDKYELSIKEDKIKKHAEKKDYVTAAKIADTIDWSRVKNIKMLTLVSQVYEKVRNYADAKNVLLLAYERVPVGRRMLYKLTELCVKSGELDEAEEFFEEFQEIAPNDISKLILAYQIEAARGEPLDKLIMILELYRKNEFEEKWAYELAFLYHKAGRVKDCVQLCNEIILWFSVGPYVDKALNLKMQYEPLTPSQQEKLVNKKKFEERVKAVEREFEAKYSLESIDMKGNATEPDYTEERMEEAAMTNEYGEGYQEPYPEEFTEEASVDETGDMLFQSAAFRDIEADLAQSIRAAEELPEAEPVPAQDTKEIFGQTKEIVKPEEEMSQTTDFLNEVSAALAASVFAEEAPAAEEMPAEEEPEEELPAEPAAEEAPVEEVPAEPDVFFQPEEFVQAALAQEEAPAPAAEPEVPAEPEPETEPEMPAEPEPAAEPERYAIPEASADVTDDSLAELQGLLAEGFEEVEEEPNPNRITCVVVDENPGSGRIAVAVEKLKKTHEILGVPATQVAKITGEKLNAKGIHVTFEKLAGRDLIVDNAADMNAATAAELAEELRNPFVSMVILLVDSTDKMDHLLAANPELDMQCVYLEDDSQMSVDDFVACANAYAREEECVIDEMAGLALYAAAERMRNDGVPLTEDGARDLVDEAIDKAEHRGIKGLFASKYDKEGYLILKEQFFKNI